MNLRGVINIPSASLNSGTTYNILCGAAPAHQQIAITGFSFGGTFNEAATPGLLQFCTSASQGTSGTTFTPLPLVQQDTTTFQSTWIGTPSGAPSTIVALDSRVVNPQLSITELWGANDWYVIKGGGFFVVQFTPQQTTNYAGWFRILE